MGTQRERDRLERQTDRQTGGVVWGGMCVCVCYLVVILVDVLVELMKSNEAVHLRGEALQTHRMLNRQHKLK